MGLPDTEIDRVFHRRSEVKNLANSGGINFVHPVSNPGFGHIRVSISSVEVVISASHNTRQLATKGANRQGFAVQMKKHGNTQLPANKTIESFAESELSGPANC